MQNWSKQTDHELWSAPTLALKSPRMNSSSFAGTPLMVVASLSFASSGDDRVGVWLEWPDPLMDGVLATKFPYICRRWIPAAKKGEISFPDRPWIWQPRLLKSDYVHLQSGELHIDDCCLNVRVIDFVQVVRKAWCQCPDVPSAQPLGKRFHLSIAWCRVVDPLVWFHPIPHESRWD